ncbi:MAG TPA: outer membrane beta-barrel protein [Gemmatimonadaceae bacterium]|nr:outer membrane beta-barrel protein [Gemmatimonadaceae bacterium]
MSRAVAVAAVLTPTLASAALAQRRADASTIPLARHDAPARTRNAVQQPATPTMTGPEWSVAGGVASGDNPYDIGIALGATGKWRRSDWPVAVRGDVYFAHHSGDIGSQFGGNDISINLFGVMGSAEYAIPTENKLKPYAFGGLGIFYANSDVDSPSDIGDSYYDSSTDLGFGVGGGIHLTQKFGIEVRFMNMGGFNTTPILAVWHF